MAKGWGDMPKKTFAGLKAWAKGRKTSSIEESIEGKEGIDDPRALAASTRRKALGAKEFEAHQKAARRKG